MRGVGRLASASASASPNTTKQSLLFSSSSFCSSAGGGRGRGRGVSSPYSSPVPGKLGTSDENSDASEEFAADDFTPPGRGHGRGKTLPPPVTNVFSPWRSSSSAVGRGRSSPPPPPDASFKTPIFLRRQDANADADADADSDSTPSTPVAGRGQPVKPPETDSRSPVFLRRENAASELVQTPRTSVLPQSILQGVRGAGRGQTLKPPDSDTQVREENRHLRRGRLQPGVPTTPRMNRVEVAEDIIAILGGRRGGGLEGRGRGRGGRGRGRGGRGIQAGRGRGGRGASVGLGADVIPGVDKDILGLLLGESIDEDALRQRLGEEKMSKLKEVVNEINYSVFPYPLKDLYLDALDTNFLVSISSMLDK